MRGCTAVVWLSVGHENVVQAAAFGLQLLLEGIDVQLAELLVRCVHQRRLLLPENQEAVVGGTILQPAAVEWMYGVLPRS